MYIALLYTFPPRECNNVLLLTLNEHGYLLFCASRCLESFGCCGNKTFGFPNAPKRINNTI